MCVLILGGSGMLGHKLYQVLRNEFEIKVTFREFDSRLKAANIFKESEIIQGIEVNNFDSVKTLCENLKPAMVINCIGIIKQQKEAQNSKISIYINSLFPHLLAEICTDINTKLIHISTDCVFSGEKGNYTEDDNPDPVDLYGRSKLLGEINYDNHLTIRTSIIGHELNSKISLIDWFLEQNNKKVNGFSNAIYSGLPTLIFAMEIGRIIKEFPNLKGLYNVSSSPISKFELLKFVKEIYKLNIDIEPFNDFYCNRSLDSSKYRKETKFNPLTWEKMIEMMYEDYLLNYKYKGIK